MFDFFRRATTFFRRFFRFGDRQVKRFGVLRRVGDRSRERGVDFIRFRSRFFASFGRFRFFIAANAFHFRGGRFRDALFGFGFDGGRGRRIVGAPIVDVLRRVDVLRQHLLQIFPVALFLIFTHFNFISILS